MFIDKSNRFVAYSTGAILILILVIFPLATAEETAPDSSSPSTESPDSGSSEPAASSDSENSEDSGESSGVEDSQQPADQTESAENSGEENDIQDSSLPDEDLEIEQETETTDDLIPEDYNSDENALYYELGEEMPEENNMNTEPSPEYYEIIPEDYVPENKNGTSLTGDVVEIVDNTTNTSEFYIELGEIKDNDFNIEFNEIEQQEIYVDEPVEIHQKITLINEDDYEKEITVNLWNYEEEILKGAESVDVFRDGEIISEEPILQTLLSAGETQEMDIVYKYPPVAKKVTFSEKTIIDLLPDQAKVTDSEIPVDTLIEKKCNIKVYHEGPLHYFNVHVPITEVEPEDIKSIYFVEGDKYLTIDSNTITLPKSEDSDNNSSMEEDVQ